MFAYCCGHATIVALGQPLFGLDRISPALPASTATISRVRAHSPSQPQRDCAENFAADSPRIMARQLICRHAPPRIAKRNSNHIPAASDRSIPPECDARTENTPPDINRVRKGSRHFCAAGTFCARFRHAMMQPAPRAPTADSSFIQGRTTSCAICRRRF